VRWRNGAPLPMKMGAYDAAIRHALNPTKRLEPDPRNLVHTQYPLHLSGKAERLADQPNGVFHVQPIKLA